MSLWSWLRGTRASVSVEFVAGAVIFVIVTVGGMDVYRIIEGSVAATRTLKTMTEYFGLEHAPKKSFVRDLATFSRQNEGVVSSQVAFVISVVGLSGDKDAEPKAKWTHRLAVGPASDPPPPRFVDTCSRVMSSQGAAALPAVFAMSPSEVVIVVEVCLKLLPKAFMSVGLLSQNLFPSQFYRYSISPARRGAAPIAPL